MTTIFAHIQIKPHMTARFEEIIRDMVKQTHSHEENVLRYEYYRGAKEHSYICLLAFRSKMDFYLHQEADYHEGYLDDFEECFESIELEYVDPMENGGSNLGPTIDTPLLPDAPPIMRERQIKNPIHVAAWWHAMRGKTKK